MSSQPRRGIALVLLVLLVPLAGATHDPTDPLHANQGLPDLFATSEDVPPGADEATPPMLCGAVFNHARNAHVLTPFAVELHVDGTPMETTQVTQQLAPGSSVRLCWTLDEPLARGTHRFHVVADAEGDVPESNETNNVARERAFTVASLPRPDLRVKSLQVVPRVARADGWQTAFITIENVGRADAPEAAFEVLEENVVLSTVEMRPLAAGRSVSYAFYMDPALRRPGNFSLSLTLDPLDLVPESNEANNGATTRFEVPVRPLPDLAPRDARINGTLEARRGLRLDVALDNLGNATATRPHARVLLGNATLANATGPTLAPGANGTLTFHFVLPAGEHALRVVLDPDASLIEWSEDNNALTLNVSIRPAATDVALPNLLVKRVDANPTDPGPQEPVMLTALVHNAGEKSSNATNVTFYADGRILARRPLAALKPDSYATVVHPWGNHTRGDHDLRIVVDVQDAVRESDEEDNAFLAYVTLADATPIRPPANQTPVEVNETPEDPAETPPPAEETPLDAPPEETVQRLAIGELTISTRPVPGGLKGVLVVSLRNPSLEQVGRIGVTFTVDGQEVLDTVVAGLRPAGTASATTGEIDLPPGERDVPAPTALFLLACLGAAALARTRRRA